MKISTMISLFTYRLTSGWVGWLPLSVFAVMILLANQVHADVRVLIKFDGAGHRIHRLVHTETTRAELMTRQATKFASQNSSQQLSQQDTASQSNSAQVIVDWIDAKGQILQSTSISDPRLAHAPLSTAEFSPTIVSLSEGAYMLSGPNNSAQIQIHLPANNAHALVSQTWNLALE